MRCRCSGDFCSVKLQLPATQQCTEVSSSSPVSHWVTLSFPSSSAIRSVFPTLNSGLAIFFNVPVRRATASSRGQRFFLFYSVNSVFYFTTSCHNLVYILASFFPVSFFAGFAALFESLTPPAALHALALQLPPLFPFFPLLALVWGSF